MTIRLNRPENLNALTGAMREDLAAAIRSAGRKGQSSGLVITGEGRAFSAGEDLTEAVEFRHASEVEEAIGRFHQISRALLGTEVPVVAAINGIAVGGASELTFACDTRIGSQEAEFFMPENGRGLTISNATSFLLPRLVGARALAFVLDSRRIGAQEALRIGLLDSVVAVDELEATARARLVSWTAPGSTYAHHLDLLRPRMEDVETAMRRETAVAVAAWEQGLTTSGIRDFLSGSSGTGKQSK